MKCTNCGNLIQSEMVRIRRGGSYYHMNKQDCMITTSHFGSKLKALRKKAGVSAKKLGKAAGVSEWVIYQQEKKIISDELYKKLRGLITEIKSKVHPKTIKLRASKIKQSKEQKLQHGLEFKKLRTSLGLSRRDLGKTLGPLGYAIHPNRVESWERGLACIPQDIQDKINTMSIKKTWDVSMGAIDMSPGIPVKGVADVGYKLVGAMEISPGNYHIRIENHKLTLTPIYDYDKISEIKQENLDLVKTIEELKAELDRKTYLAVSLKDLAENIQKALL